MSDSDLFQLYSHRILALAATIPHDAPLAEPGTQGSCRAPLCGSTVTVELAMEDDRIARFSQKVQACALGQASASIFGAAVIGCSAQQIVRLRDELAAMLEGGPAPAAPFADYEILRAAKDYPNRHASILLAPDATLAALGL